MAMEESQFDLDSFCSDVELEDLYEREIAFRDEVKSQSLARLDWLLTKHRAAFIVLASELGLDAVTVAKLSTAQQILTRNISDFVSIGIDPAHDMPPLHHPLESVYDEIVDEIIEPSRESASNTIEPAHKRMTALVYGADEDLLHHLEHLRPTTET